MSSQGEARAGSEIRSYIVMKSQGKWKIVPSYWAPGYTPAHAATPAEAKAKRIAELELLIIRTQADLHNVEDLRVPTDHPTAGVEEKGISNGQG